MKPHLKAAGRMALRRAWMARPNLSCVELAAIFRVSENTVRAMVADFIRPTESNKVDYLELRRAFFQENPGLPENAWISALVDSALFELDQLYNALRKAA